MGCVGLVGPGRVHCKAGRQLRAVSVDPGDHYSDLTGVEDLEEWRRHAHGLPQSGRDFHQVAESKLTVPTTRRQRRLIFFSL